MSKMHKSSKRKDLAFVTYETHDEAKNAVESFKQSYGEGNIKEEEITALQEDTKFENIYEYNEEECQNNNYSNIITSTADDNNEQIYIITKQSPNKNKISTFCPLGNNVNVSLAFSQQAMQAKKKIKESRKKGTVQITTSNSGHSLHNPQSTLNSISTPSPMQPTPNLITSNLSTGTNNINTTAMLAMMNLINMNKVLS
jgi:hypothetical protein